MSSSRNLKKMRRSELPSELAVEILARVPVKDLLRFKCVCKTWRSLFQDERFIEQHRTHAPTRIMSFRWDTPPCRFSYSSGKPEVIVEELSLNNIGDENELLNASLIGQCHGLFCLDLDEDNAFGVWNPALRELRRIQIRGLNDCAEMGFGYDHSSQDYKIVFALDMEGIDSRALVFSLKSGEFRMIDFPWLESMTHTRDSGTLVGENIYWQVYEDGGKVSETFLRFDLVSDTFSYCKGPSHCGEEFPHITSGLRGGGLCTVEDDPCGGIIVWSAQHEKDKIGGGGIKSWSKICSLSRAVLESSLSRSIDKISVTSAVAFAGLLLLLVSIGREAKLLAYNVEEKSLTSVKTNLPIDSCGLLQTYVETLVPIPNSYSCQYGYQQPN